jgi:hypothetical protein
MSTLNVLLFLVLKEKRAKESEPKLVCFKKLPEERVYTKTSNVEISSSNPIRISEEKETTAKRMSSQTSHESIGSKSSKSTETVKNKQIS